MDTRRSQRKETEHTRLHREVAWGAPGLEDVMRIAASVGFRHGISERVSLAAADRLIERIPQSRKWELTIELSNGKHMACGNVTIIHYDGVSATSMLF